MLISTSNTKKKELAMICQVQVTTTYVSIHNLESPEWDE